MSRALSRDLSRALSRALCRASSRASIELCRDDGGDVHTDDCIGDYRAVHRAVAEPLVGPL